MQRLIGAPALWIALSSCGGRTALDATEPAVWESRARWPTSRTRANPAAGAASFARFFRGP
jgi:hypothetical protein